MITYNISHLFRENTNNCKNGKEAHNEPITAYWAMGFLKLDQEIKFKIALGSNTIFYQKDKRVHTHTFIQKNTQALIPWRNLLRLLENWAVLDPDGFIWLSRQTKNLGPWKQIKNFCILVRTNGIWKLLLDEFLVF